MGFVVVLVAVGAGQGVQSRGVDRESDANVVVFSTGDVRRPEDTHHLLEVRLARVPLLAEADLVQRARRADVVDQLVDGGAGVVLDRGTCAWSARRLDVEPVDLGEAVEPVGGFPCRALGRVDLVPPGAGPVERPGSIGGNRAGHFQLFWFMAVFTSFELGNVSIFWGERRRVVALTPRSLLQSPIGLALWSDAWMAVFSGSRVEVLVDAAFSSSPTADEAMAGRVIVEVADILRVLGWTTQLLEHAVVTMDERLLGDM